VEEAPFGPKNHGPLIVECIQRLQQVLRHFALFRVKLTAEFLDLEDRVKLERACIGGLEDVSQDGSEPAVVVEVLNSLVAF
jgi:hypothetical protein